MHNSIKVPPFWVRRGTDNKQVSTQWENFKTWWALWRNSKRVLWVVQIPKCRWRIQGSPQKGVMCTESGRLKRNQPFESVPGDRKELKDMTLLTYNSVRFIKKSLVTTARQKGKISKCLRTSDENGHWEKRNKQKPPKLQFTFEQLGGEGHRPPSALAPRPPEWNSSCNLSPFPPCADSQLPFGLLLNNSGLNWEGQLNWTS